jgi:hypothetical protein
MKTTNSTLGYLNQTAIDYDLPISVVKRVYEKYRGVEFYTALEQLHQLTQNN